MKPFISSLLPLLLLAPLHADEATETKLRQSLRSTTTQLQEAQSQTGTAQAAAFAAEARAKAAEEKIAELEKAARKAADEKASSEKTIASLNNRLAERESRLAEYIAAIDKWKAGYDSLTTAARAAEDERKRLTAETTAVKRTLEDRERKNLALFNLSNEILTRYENFSLGRSLAAKEPFIGNARVRAENLVQDYKDRILESRLNAPAPKPQPKP